MEPIDTFFKYKHISFDLWLTLIKSNPDYKPRRNQLFKSFFNIQKPIEEVASVIRKFDILTNTINEKVTRNLDVFEIYYLILDGLHVDIETYTRENLLEFYSLTEELLLQFKPVLLDNGLPMSLETLVKEDKTLNILSNTAFIKGKSLRKVLDHYGIGDLFSFQAYSDETGFSKPGMEMYDYAYQKIKNLGDIKKSEVLHVGDNVVSDYNGALSYGFDAHLITNLTPDESKLQPL